MAKTRIKKILGFKNDNQDNLFRVMWNDNKTTWEPVSNLDCPSLINIFLHKLKENIYKAILHNDEKKKKESEKKFISGLKFKLKDNTTAFNPLSQNTSSKLNSGSTTVPNAYAAFLSNKRYFEQPTALKEAKKHILQIEVPKRVNPDLIYFHYNDKSIATFRSKFLYGDGIQKLNNKFSGIDCIDQFLIETFLFSYYQNPDQYKEISVFILGLDDNEDIFSQLRKNLLENHKCIVDSGNSQYWEVFILGSDLMKKYDIIGSFNIMRIPSKYLNVNSSQLNHDAFFKNDIVINTYTGWFNFTPQYNHLVENQLIFCLDSLEISSKRKFSIFARKNSALSFELKTFLIKRGWVYTSILSDDVSHIFIYEEYTEYLEYLPKYSQLIESPVKFYSFGLNSPKLSQILVSGGIFTLTIDVLKNEDSFDLFPLIKLACESNLWDIKIPGALLAEYKKLMASAKDTIRYSGMKEIYDMLTYQVEDFDCDSIEKYIKCIENKYLRTKRFFFIINDVAVGPYIKTPEQIMQNYIKKY